MLFIGFDPYSWWENEHQKKTSDASPPLTHINIGHLTPGKRGSPIQPTQSGARLVTPKIYFFKILRFFKMAAIFIKNGGHFGSKWRPF